MLGTVQASVMSLMAALASQERRAGEVAARAQQSDRGRRSAAAVDGHRRAAATSRERQESSAGSSLPRTPVRGLRTDRGGGSTAGSMPQRRLASPRPPGECVFLSSAREPGLRAGTARLSSTPPAVPAAAAHPLSGRAVQSSVYTEVKSGNDAARRTYEHCSSQPCLSSSGSSTVNESAGQVTAAGSDSSLLSPPFLPAVPAPAAQTQRGAQAVLPRRYTSPSPTQRVPNPAWNVPIAPLNW